MICGAGRAATGAVTLAAAGLGIGLAVAPAAASVCGFGIDSPADGSFVAASEVTFRGPFAVSGDGGRTLQVDFTSSPGPAPAPVTRAGADLGTDGSRYVVTVGGLARNGQYTARLRAGHAADASCGADPGPSTVDRTVTFGVSVKAQPPTSVRSRLDAGPRVAVVTWEKSSDPDIAAYGVTRKVGAAAAEPVADLPTTPTTWTDLKLPAAATSITYSVVAYRTGSTSSSRSAASEPVAAAPLAVPARPASSAPLTAARPTAAARRPPDTKAPAAPAATAAPVTPLPPASGLPGSPDPAGGYQSPQTAVPSLDQGLIPLAGAETSVAGGDGDGDGGGPDRGLAVAAGVALSAAAALVVRRQRRRQPPGSPPVVAEALPLAAPDDPLESFAPVEASPAGPAEWAADELAAPVPAAASKLILVVKPPPGAGQGGDGS